MSADRFAPPGAIWVCGACGKTARDQYGLEGEHSPGWDESCMLNAVLCRENSLYREGGRVTKADPWSANPATEATSDRAGLAEEGRT